MDRKPSIKRTFGLVVMVALAGCATKPRVQRVGPVLASYSFRTLTADLGADLRVPAVVTAAEFALADRGYTVSSRWMTEDAGRVIAHAQGSAIGFGPRDAMLEKVVVSAALTASGTRVKVTAEPMGNEAFSRAILDDMLRRLGL
jgi:hypothetical protein